jgi:hypothetical protein
MAAFANNGGAAPLLHNDLSHPADDGAGRAETRLDSWKPRQEARRGSFWQPHIDIESGKRYFKLPRAELRLSKDKLVLARLCFFLTAMTLYTFSDTMDNIGSTILLEYNASSDSLEIYDNLEPCVVASLPRIAARAVHNSRAIGSAAGGSVL